MDIWSLTLLLQNQQSSLSKSQEYESDKENDSTGLYSYKQNTQFNKNWQNIYKTVVVAVKPAENYTLSMR